MLERFDHIANIGRYERIQNSPTFGQLSVVYSENARGKTTLCAILRSLTTADPAFIEERKRLSATSDPGVVAQVSGNSHVYANGSWNQSTPPRILVFDERFVNENIYSGLSVDAGHRKNLHELVLGHDGVRFQTKVSELTERISNLQKVVREKQSALAPEIRGTLNIDEFCSLEELDGLDDAIDEATTTLSVIEGASKVAATEHFEPFGLPQIDSSAVSDALSSSLAELEGSSLDAVKRRIEDLGESSGQWLSQGLDLATGRETCPFCDQDLSTSRILADYQAYFSAAYSAHIQSISQLRNTIAGVLSGDALAKFQRSLQATKTKATFWGNYVDLPPLGTDDQAASDFFDGELTSTVWIELRKRLLELLDRKSSSPLESCDLDETTLVALSEYNKLADGIDALSSSLVACNSKIKKTKEQAKHGNLATVKGQLSRLIATKKRFEPQVQLLCDEYLQAKSDKESAEIQKEQAKKDLDTHRNTTFPKHEIAINKYLLRFNADFTVSSLRPTDPRGEPSSTYQLTVNRHAVALASNSATPKPSFSNTLSAGDKNTLALAFFFASLEEYTSLHEAIVVIDDPASSLDDGRTVATAQEIRSLCGKAKQVVILSHSKRLLCEIWEHTNPDAAASLQVEDNNQDSSVLTDWNVHAAAITEYDRRHRAIREYLNNRQGSANEIAQALRPVLEGFLRTACVEHFPPGKMLGPFINEARQSASKGTPLMSADDLEELDKLREYANRFHHDNPAWQRELASLNQTELTGFAKRVIAFTQAIRRIT